MLSPMGDESKTTRFSGGLLFLNVIEHDIDVMKNADYIIDMGPGGGKDGGRIVASGTIDKIKNNNESITGRYL